MEGGVDPTYVLQFAAHADTADIVWVLERLVKAKTQGGAELLVKCSQPVIDKVGYIFYFSFNILLIKTIKTTGSDIIRYNEEGPNFLYS